jgi:acetylornithine deacetylase/succinyl-diaminopimelate desuccinylase-like protein
MERRTLGRLMMTGLLAAVARGAEANAPPLDELVSRHAAATFREWVELLAIPNVATVGTDIQRNVAWLEQAFQRRGFRTRQLANDDKPMLLAAVPGAAPDRRTVLFYAHLDGQPVNPAEWSQRSPWEPVLKRRTAEGRWEPLPLDRLYGPEIDPEWRLFARSAADDKAPIVMLLAAIDTLKAAGQAPSINVKVLLDSQEEQGSPSLGRVIGENLEALRCDALVVLDGPMHESNRPTLVFGNRGVVAATLTVFGGASYTAATTATTPRTRRSASPRC